MKSFYIFFYLIIFFCIPLLCDAGNSSVVYRQVGFRQDNCLHNQWSYADSSQQSDYIYDSIFGKLIRQNVRQWNDSAWVPDYYTENTLDEFGNIIATTRYSWNSISNFYQRTNLNSFGYNIRNFKISDTTYLWNSIGNDWSNQSLYNYSYDSVGLSTNIQIRIWDSINQVWENSYFTSRLWIGNRLYNSGIFEWTNGILSSYDSIQYIINSSGNIAAELYTVYDTTIQSWIINEIDTFTYDNKGNQLIETDFYVDTTPNSFAIGYYDSSAYDNNGFLVTDYINGKGRGYVFSSKLTYINDSVGNDLIRIQSDWNDSSQTWVNFQKYSMTYNTNHRMLSDTAEWWNNGSWQYLEFFNYNYNNKNRETLSEHYSIVEGGIWLMLQKVIWVYDTNSNLLFVSDQYNQGGDTLSLTGYRDYYYYEALDISNNISAPPSKLCIYPDPASQTLNIALPEPYANEPYAVYDLLGQTMTNGYLTGNNYSIDVSGYSDGLYVIRVSSLTQKFIVKR